MSRTPFATALFALAMLGVAIPARAQEIGLSAREALAGLLTEGQIIVYGAVVDTVHNYDFFKPFGEFAAVVDPPPGSQLRYVHARVEVRRVLRGRAPGREITLSIPVEYLPGLDTLGAAADTGRVAAGGTGWSLETGGTPAAHEDDEARGIRVPELAPGVVGVFALIVEPLAPGGLLLQTMRSVIPEENGKVAGENIVDLAMAARGFYGRRTIESLAVNAEAIVVGEVARIRPACLSGRDTVLACVEMNVFRTFKTDIDTTITVYYPDAAATSWRVPLVRNDLPDLEVGEERYFFLVHDEKGRWRLLEGKSGIFRSANLWITEWPRDGGPLVGLNMDPDSFQGWLDRMLQRAERGEIRF